MKNITLKFKIGIIGVFITTLLIGGTIMYRGIVHNKRVYESELYSYLPNDVSAVLQVNKEKGLDNANFFLEDLLPVILQAKNDISYPSIICRFEKSNYLLAKVTNQQECTIKDLLDYSVFPTYLPKEQFYKKHRLYLYAISDKKFFICTFCNGIFIAGHNIKFFQEYIDNLEANNKGMIDTAIGKDAISRLKKHYSANLLLNNSSYFTVFNINLDNKIIEMDGSDTQINFKKWEYRNTKDSININYSIFPDSVNMYRVDIDNFLVSDSFKCEFTPPSYMFIINNKFKPIFALEHKDDRFHIYNILNSLEEKYSGKKFNTNDFHEGYRIYTTSLGLANDFWGLKRQIYLTFFKDYMFFSEDKHSLVYYLTHNGKFRKSNYFMNEQILGKQSFDKSVIYTNNLKMYSPDFFKADNPIRNNYNGEAYMTSITKNNKKMYKVWMSNEIKY